MQNSKDWRAYRIFLPEDTDGFSVSAISKKPTTKQGVMEDARDYFDSLTPEKAKLELVAVARDEELNDTSGTLNIPFIALADFVK